MCAFMKGPPEPVFPGYWGAAHCFLVTELKGSLNILETTPLLVRLLLLSPLVFLFISVSPQCLGKVCVL